ncbi:helix-turn-helix domain-containing protein [Actinoallomurus sp. CA-142502]|uniref:helix-turn-helix domain-containing protein n=1 Tax=Actinoallomurus sp. CA-142502 TaxID=3239885 RepID=UPI003D89DFEA
MVHFVQESDGARVRRFRRRAGFTQAELGARVGRTQGWVSMLENDEIVLDSISLINTIARELRVHPNELTGRPYRHGRTPAEDRGHASIGEIRRQIQRYDLVPDWNGAVRNVEELKGAVKELTELRQKASYIALGEKAPAVLAELQAATAMYAGRDKEACFGLLAVAYRETDAFIYGLGYEDLSVLATRCMRWAAARSGDPYLVTVGNYLRVRELWSTASWDDALTVIDDAITSVQGPCDAGDRPALAIWGGLQLRASITAARKLDADEAYARLHLAHEAVDRLGNDDRNDYYKLVFTRPNVAIHDVAVAVELGDGVEAIKRSTTLRIPADMPASRSGHHYLDLSRGWLFYGNRDRALAAMEKAERIAPALVRNHPMAQKTVRTLLDAEVRGYRERVRRLGARMNVL